MKFDIGVFLKICRENSSFIKIYILLRMRNVSDKSRRRSEHTFLVQAGQETDDNMIPKATNTLSEYVILIAILQTMF